MDPSYYSPQVSKGGGHAVCFCRVHGTFAKGHYFGDVPSPPSPVTRQLIQQHPEAVVIQGSPGKPSQMVPCHVVYHHHQPVYGYMAHNTLDGATAIARQRRQQQPNKCQDPRCCQHKASNSKKSRKNHASSKNSKQSTPTKNPSPQATVCYKSAPSSPVGTPRKLLNLTTYNAQVSSNNSRKKELTLSPQWITAFPTIETPSESGFPITANSHVNGKLTGCCGRTTAVNNTRRPRSNSYSALDSTSDDGTTISSQDDVKTVKKPVRFFSQKAF